MSYSDFIARKQKFGGNSGFEPLWIPDWAFDFQKHLIEWAILKGRGAIFAECGLGKTPMALAWAENVVRKTNKRVLILTTLAVGAQFVRDGEKFGIECKQSKDGKLASKITVANYERLHYFKPDDFVGVVADESGILKNFKGSIKADVTEFMRTLPHRLLATATPSPNDFNELGTSSEALGELAYLDMLHQFFKADGNNYASGGRGGGRWSDNPFEGKFRLRGHAERDFWRWVCSWARAVRKPSDLGFDDGAFILPPLVTTQHVVKSKTLPPGYLLSVPAVNLGEQREERKRTLTERCEMAASKINGREGHSIAWCYLNPEGDLLEKLIPTAVQISGADELERKEEVLEAFQKGEIKDLVSKPDICGHGLNFQHCDHQTFFPSHSFEQYYQAVRRSWRFGQTKTVYIDVITSEGETKILKSQTRKAAAAEQMFARLVELMNEELKVMRRLDNFKIKVKKPSFL